MFVVRFAVAWRVLSVVSLMFLAACATENAAARKGSARTQQAPAQQSAKAQQAPNAQQAPKAAAKPPASPPATAHPTPTRLSFDWGNELNAKVFAIREEFTFKGESETVSRLEAEFQLHAVRQNDRYTLSFSELSMKLDGRPIPDNAQPAMLGPISGLVLNYDIAGNGDFLGQHDLGKLQSFTERRYLERNELAAPENRLSQKDALAAMKIRSAPEVLQLEASRTWGALVGMWAGVTLTEGKPLASDASVTIPVVNLPLTVHSTFELVRQEVCESGDRKRACVRLRATSRPDATQLAEAQRKLKESTGGPVESLSLNGLKVEDRYEVLTDPQTLRPRSAEWVRGADIEGTEQDSGLLQSRQSTRTRMVFVYK